MQQTQQERTLGVALMMPRYRIGGIAVTPPSMVRRGQGYQFYHIVPPDVMQISAGMAGIEVPLEAGNIEQADVLFWEAVDLLAKEKVDLVHLGGVPVSANYTRARVLERIRQVKEKHGLPMSGTLEATIAAMQRLGLKTLTVGSRWADKLNKDVIKYLNDGGIEVPAITTRGQMPTIAMSQMAAQSFEYGLEMALDVGREAARLAPNADAIFVPGGFAMSLHVVPTLEAEFGKPVFVNTTVDVWHDLVRPGIIPPIQGWGKLLEAP